MANRLLNQFLFSLEKKPVKLFATIAIGATGAPTVSASLSKGLASVVRNSAGKYTLTLQDAFQALLGCVPTLKLAAGDPNHSAMVVRSYSGKALAIEFLDETGTPAELPSGTTVMLEMTFRDSTF
jgi:hypothetical protein